MPDDLDDTVFRSLGQIAPYANRLTKDPASSPVYEGLSDSLLWEDEFNGLGTQLVRRKIDPGVANVLRFLLRYRTTVILGEPDEKLQRAWEEGYRLFPNWPGFAPERCSIALAEVFFRGKREFETSCREMLKHEAAWNRQRRRDSKKPQAAKKPQPEGANLCFARVWHWILRAGRRDKFK